MDFIAIGDTAVDEFIKLDQARINCDINNQNCTISMKWGDKIPFEFSVLVPGVGNATNAAVAARLGLSSGFISNVGKIATAKKLSHLSHERRRHEIYCYKRRMPTNHHYVLWYEAGVLFSFTMRRIPISFRRIYPPKWIYLSSAGEHSEAFHGELAVWLQAPRDKARVPAGHISNVYGQRSLRTLRAELVACNKEEAERIRGRRYDIKELLEKCVHLVQIILITDGPNGAYSFDGTEMLKIGMYPDPKPPVDRTGAGDASTSTIVVAIALGKPLREALLWGPINSISVVQEIGAQKGLLTRESLETFLKNAPADYRVESF